MDQWTTFKLRVTLKFSLFHVKFWYLKLKTALISFFEIGGCFIFIFIQEPSLICHYTFVKKLDFVIKWLVFEPLRYRCPSKKPTPSYRKVASSGLSWLVAHFLIFRRLMNNYCKPIPVLALYGIAVKGKFDAYMAKKFQNWIVDQSTARDFTVY